MYIEKIKGPKDLKKIDKSKLEILCNEIRNALINRISKVGGHLGPNLGVVELTTAIHYVFNSPKDKIIFDVSHQSYTHKILTGRKDSYLIDEYFSLVDGFTNPKESEHDLYRIGHTSTSISLGLGECLGRDLERKRHNVVVVIGDGSLSGGEALEGLDYAGEYNKNLIIIVNDNNHSIVENHGGIYKNLKELRDTNGKCSNNIFKSFGLDYKYLEDGHDINKLIELLESVKNIDHPIVLHIHTTKGKGLDYAEKNMEEWHSGGPFNKDDGTRNKLISNDTTVFESLKELLDNNKDAVVLNAGTPTMGLGMVKGVRDKYVKKNRFIDVGIAEENMVAMASGIARTGKTAVFATFAPFLQRTYDQVSHDLCLNNNPATMLVISPGVYGKNSDTHIGLSDIQLFSHIPNLIYLAPTTKEEYMTMFKYATTQKSHPIGIRVSSKFPISEKIDNTNYTLLKNKVENKGSGIAIFAIGPLMSLAKSLSLKVKEELNKDITIINPVFLSGLDTKLLDKLEKNHNMIITLEDGYLEGGYGQRISSYYGNSDIKVLNYGISKEFHNNFTPESLLEENGISIDNLFEIIKNNI